MQHFPNIARVAFGQHVRLAGHLFLAFSLLHEQVTRGSFAPDDLELALAAGHFESFLGT